MNITPHTVHLVALRAFSCALVTAVALITGAAPAFAQARTTSTAAPTSPDLDNAAGAAHAHRPRDCRGDTVPGGELLGAAEGGGVGRLILVLSCGPAVE